MTAAALAETLGPVLVVGDGLIGTSIGLSLRRAGIDVLLQDVDPASEWTAAQLGAGVPVESASGVEPKTVVVAVPPRFAADVIAAAQRAHPAATITDVTSVKATVLADVARRGVDMSRVVGGHPMAGREVSGALGARADLMDDRLWVLTPTDATSVESLRQAHRLVTACGAYAVEMTPREHDRAVALVSHAPQLVSSALAAQLVDAQAEHVRVAGQGLRDMTRIAASDALLWRDILSANAEPVADVIASVIDTLQHALDALRGVVEGQEQAAGDVEQAIARGAQGRARVPGKHGVAATEYATVSVMIVDRPGELARLFAAAAEVEVNLEDVSIEHVLGRPSGLVLLFVEPVNQARLTEALRERDFDVRG